MVSVKSFIFAVAAALIGTAASAADMALPPPPQIPYQPMPTVVETPIGGWYLRGDIGIGVQTFSSFNFTQTNSAFVWPPSWTIVQQDIQDTTFFGLGVGYEINNWLRVDVTGEYRTKAAFRVTGSYTDFCNGICFDQNTGNFSSAVILANAYLDLGTWWCITPYIGAGIGGAYNSITGMQDLGLVAGGTTGFGYTFGDNSNLSLAWNVQAGLTYNVTNSFKIDLNYRYLNLGSPVSAVVQCQNTPACPGAFYTFRDMTSQDIRIGVRFLLQPEAATVVMPVAAPPVYAPAPPVYAPQYQPLMPPLMSRG